MTNRAAFVTTMARLRRLILTLGILFMPAIAMAETVTLAWDRNPESDVTSYIVSYGTKPRGIQTYPTTIDVGNVTTYSFTRPSSELQLPYYFSVRAKNSAGLISPYSQEIILESVGGLPAIPGTPDFNTDGNLDLIWHHKTNGLLVTWYMNGANIIGASTIGQASDTNWKVAGTGDFNGDGKADMLWWHDVTGAFALWYMNGPNIIGGGTLSISTLTDHNWQVKGIKDMNGDGKVDIVWQHSITGVTIIWLMNGPNYVGGLTLVAGPVGDPNWKIAGIADMNGDGMNDLIWQHDITGTVNTWFMNGTSLMGAADIYPSGAVSDPLWKVKAIADLNGDRKPDFIWQHMGQGYVAIWMMNGTYVMHQYSVTQITDRDWYVAGPR